MIASRLLRAGRRAAGRMRTPLQSVHYANLLTMFRRNPAQRWTGTVSGGTAGEDDAQADALSKPIVEIHHPEQARVMKVLMTAKGTGGLLDVFSKEGKDFGWATANETIARI